MRTRTLPSRPIAGVEVRLDASVLVLVGLVAWAFSTIFLVDNGIAVAILLSGIGALLVLLTTLAHELGHALEARHRGMRVEAVTLLLFGGVTEMHADGQSARDEMAIAAVGPWISLVCAAAFGLLATFADDLFPAAIATQAGQLAGVLGWWNLLLAVFNLVPGAPLDGGRVLRAALWMALGDRLRALRISVRCGQVIGAVLIVLGVAVVIRGGPGAGLVAAALVLSGVFLIRSAATELRHAELNAALEGRRVVDLLAAAPAPLAPGRRIASVDTDHLDVVAGDLHTVGEPEGSTTDHAVVEHDQLLKARATGAEGPEVDRTIGELAEPLGDVPGVHLEDDLHTLIDAFQGDHHVVRILRDGRTIGALTEREVARAVARLRRGESPR